MLRKKHKKKKTTDSGYKVFYLCDGRKDDCSKGHCYKDMCGTGCRHTSDIWHAENFHLEDTGTDKVYFENQKEISGCQCREEEKEMGKPKITLEVEGTEELGRLIGKLYDQISEMGETLSNIKMVSLKVQAKINQPSERADG